jgi:hypothetical protein
MLARKVGLGLRAAALWVPFLAFTSLVPAPAWPILIGVPVAALAGVGLVDLARPGVGRRAGLLVRRDTVAAPPAAEIEGTPAVGSTAHVEVGAGAGLEKTEELSLRRMSAPVRMRVIAVVSAAIVVGVAGAALGQHAPTEAPASTDAALPRLDAGLPNAPFTPTPTRAGASRTVSHSPSASPSASPSSTKSAAASPSTASMAPMVPVVPTSAPPTTAAAGCSVKYRNSSEWNNGFVATVAVTNTGPSAISGWTLVYSYTAGQKLSGSWQATVRQSGPTITASDGATIAPGASASFGIQGTWQTADPAPSSYTLNGKSCTVG